MYTEVTRTSLAIRNPHIVLREEFDDWALLYNPDNGRSVGLTPTGVSIWQSLSKGKNLDGIIQALTKEFDHYPRTLWKISGHSVIRSFGQGLPTHDRKPTAHESPEEP